MEFNPLPHLLNTGFTIAEIGLFYGGEHFGAKICSLLTWFDKMAICENTSNTSFHDFMLFIFLAFVPSTSLKFWIKSTRSQKLLAMQVKPFVSH